MDSDLYVAVTNDNIGVLKEMEGSRLSVGAQPTPTNNTVLHLACQYGILNQGGLDCAKLLQHWKGDLIKIPDNYGWTVFHYVAYNNLHKKVEYLVGADKDKSVVYQPDKEYKRTALHVAAYTGNIGVMQELLRYCPDSLELVDGSGRNILHIAVEQDRKPLISFILSFGANNNLLIKRDNQGNTPLHMIANLGCYVPELMDPSQGDLEVDWEILDKQNLSPIDILHCRQKTDTSADQAMARRTLISADLWLEEHLLVPTEKGITCGKNSRSKRLRGG
ncbi:hypothetical protein POM88_024710 [Heracleum sosnowskyi]|uniref:Uncharacterized protein n=1 Tax=Heracleum sosnowskyi TaxID=360622 RepID=A0AAD8I3I5_9APIA|nr:hypothetical protein POM88_024710 [Heracleum sosnowskyi]